MLDALHFPKLADRFWQNLRRCAGYKVQHFAVIESPYPLASTEADREGRPAYVMPSALRAAPDAIERVLGQKGGSCHVGQPCPTPFT